MSDDEWREFFVERDSEDRNDESTDGRSEKFQWELSAGIQEREAELCGAKKRYLSELIMLQTRTTELPPTREPGQVLVSYSR